MPKYLSCLLTEIVSQLYLNIGFFLMACLLYYVSNLIPFFRYIEFLISEVQPPGPGR